MTKRISKKRDRNTAVSKNLNLTSRECKKEIGVKQVLRIFWNPFYAVFIHKKHCMQRGSSVSQEYI